MDFGLASESKARNSHARSPSDARQDGVKNVFPDSEALKCTSNHLVRGHKSLDHFSRELFSRTAQDELLNSMNKQYERLVRCRARCTALRSQSGAARKHWQRLLSQYHQITSAYETALDPYKSVSASSPQQQDVVVLRGYLIEIGKVLEGQSFKIRIIRGDLHEAQIALEHCELEFMELARLSNSQSNPQSTSSTSAYTHTTHTTQPDRRPSWQTSGSSMPDPLALREEYFKWAADVNMYGEQLADHNYEYWTSLADRERRQDQEEVLSLADEDFEADAQKRRDFITRALDEAIDNADRLKAECEELGIDLNPQRRNIWDLEDEALSDEDIKARAEYRKAFDAALTIVPPEAFENAELVLATPSDHGSEQLDFLAPSERTGSWVETLSQEQYLDEAIDEPKPLDHG
jgi:hypothetical protein